MFSDVLYVNLRVRLRENEQALFVKLHGWWEQRCGLWDSREQDQRCLHGEPRPQRPLHLSLVPCPPPKSRRWLQGRWGALLAVP